MQHSGSTSRRRRASLERRSTEGFEGHQGQGPVHRRELARASHQSRAHEWRIASILLQQISELVVGLAQLENQLNALGFPVRVLLARSHYWFPPLQKGATTLS